MQGSQARFQKFTKIGPVLYKSLELYFSLSKPSNVKFQKINLELAYKKALNDINFEYGIEDLNILIGNYTGNHKKLRSLCNFSFKKIESLDT